MLEAVDWSRTELGDRATWSPALRGAVDLVAQTLFPATLLWGPDYTLVYNEAFIPIVAGKHPASLGATAHEAFPEAWDFIEPLLDKAMSGRGATWIEDAPVPLVRDGRLHEAYFTFSYSAVSGADGVIEGVIAIVSETTPVVLERRRQRVLSRLREALVSTVQTDEVLECTLPVLRENVDDVAEVTLTSGPADGMLVSLGRGRPRLVIRAAELVAADAGYRAFLDAIGLSLAQALDRIATGEAEQRIAALELSMSETLQRSLLPTPVQTDQCEVAVRYVPAAEQAQIGGDWYDAFLDADGRLTVVIGDVTGHDRTAAAAMAQVRNLLRGVAWTRAASPGGVLVGLDRAMNGLGVELLASAVVARIDPDNRLHWSNAGHPPPLLMEADGSVRFLATEPDALLGMELGERNDHTLMLEPGAVLLLYTDGLVERAGTVIDDGLAWLAGLVEGRHAMDLDALCDHVLAGVGHVSDDVALLAVRLR